MQTFLLSPTEHLLMDAFPEGEAVYSSLPETRGADILYYSKNGLYAAQRKEVPNDFLLSIGDGRLGKEILQLKNCTDLTFCEIIEEGKWSYWPSTQVAVGGPLPSKWRRANVEGTEFDIKWVHGIHIERTKDTDDTVRYLKDTARRLDAPSHTGAYNRPSVKGEWAIPDAEEIELYILQSFPGIGVTTAEKIVKKFGKVPLRWTCSLEELLDLHDVNSKKIKEMYSILDDPANRINYMPPPNQFAQPKKKGKSADRQTEAQAQPPANPINSSLTQLSSQLSNLQSLLNNAKNNKSTNTSSKDNIL